MPAVSIIPVLTYPDVPAAVTWLCRVFGFTERLRMGAHRVQLTLGDGALVVTSARGEHARLAATVTDSGSHHMMVRVPDVDRHYERARRFGARIDAMPQNFPYGERQYTAQDLAGHRWVFSQSIADVDPGSWGGELLQRP